MRHRKAGRKLNRTPSHRKALLSNLVNELFEHERICTTDAKAKELRTVAEKMITLGKKGDLHSRRRAFAFMRRKDTTKKLFDDIAKRFEDRQGGYTRIIKYKVRQGDAAPMSFIELTKRAEEKKEKREKVKTA